MMFSTPEMSEYSSYRGEEGKARMNSAQENQIEDTGKIQVAQAHTVADRLLTT
jgi:hypothetical protein